MSELKIIPQKFSFTRPAISNAKNETISSGIEISISIDAFQADKQRIKKDLATIFAEVLEYFD